MPAKHYCTRQGRALAELFSDKVFCKRLAEKLEIQTDGGDSPASFIQYALESLAGDYEQESLDKYYQRRKVELSP